MTLPYKKRKIAGLNVYEVTGDEGAPSIMLLHGFGADALDLLPLSHIHQERPRPTWYFPDGPLPIEIAPGYMGRAWFEISLQLLQDSIAKKRAEDLLHSFPQDLAKYRQPIENLIVELNITLSKLFLGGFSQGAVLATDIALHAFENIAGLIVLSGALVHQEEWKRLAAAHPGLHFFQSHGEKDGVLPFSGAEELEKLFLAEKFNGKLHSFHGSHEIPQNTLNQLAHFLKARIG
jgi:phospholipase/carboxylesterase